MLAAQLALAPARSDRPRLEFGGHEGRFDRVGSRFASRARTVEPYRGALGRRRRGADRPSCEPCGKKREGCFGIDAERIPERAAGWRSEDRASAYGMYVEQSRRGRIATRIGNEEIKCAFGNGPLHLVLV